MTKGPPENPPSAADFNLPLVEHCPPHGFPPYLGLGLLDTTTLRLDPRRVDRRVPGWRRPCLPCAWHVRPRREPQCLDRLRRYELVVGYRGVFRREVVAKDGGLLDALAGLLSPPRGAVAYGESTYCGFASSADGGASRRSSEGGSVVPDGAAFRPRKPLRPPFIAGRK